MEDQPKVTNNADLVSEREGRAQEIFNRIDRHVSAELNRGMVWRKLASERTRETVYSMHRLESATGVDQSRESDGVSQAAEGFEHYLISGVGHRCICEGDRYRWELENMWDTVDINHIRPAEDYEWPSNGQRDARVTTQETITVWWRMVKDWSRPDGNILSMQTLWCGNFSSHERVLQLLEDVNTANSIQILCQQFTLHRQMRRRYISRFDTNRVAAAYSATDSSLTVTMSQQLVATGGDGDGWLCAICHEIIPIGQLAKKLPCNRNHIFHGSCTTRWFHRNLSCPLCRYDFQQPRLTL